MDNKTTVKTMLAEVFEKKDTTAIDRYWTEPYIQHNPGVPNGIQVLKTALFAMESFVTKRFIAEGDFVVTHSIATGLGPKPMMAFDVFLMKDGKNIERWDIVQAQEEKTVSGRTQIDGPTEITDVEKTAENKKLVQNFFDTVLYGHKMDLVANYISTENYAQHNPGIGDGLADFGEAMKKLAEAGLTMEYKKTYRIIAEGNFVFTHSEGIFAGREVAFADLFRIEQGKIVEHWDCIQDVPATTVSGNDMFSQVTA